MHILPNLNVRLRGEAALGGIAVLWLIGSIVCTVWVMMDAKEKRGTNIGFLRTLVVFLFFPIGFIAYVLVRNAD
jgi:hypothetical protein